MNTKRTVIAMFITSICSYSTVAAPFLPTDGVSPVEVVQAANSWLEVNLTQFDTNIKDLKKHIKPDVKVCAIMKADAYGNGIAGLMPIILANNIPCIGVTSNEEIRIVRNAGFKGSLMRVRSASIAEISDTLQYDVEEFVGDINQAKLLSDIAAKLGKAIKVHLVLNSGGMGRNGVDVTTKTGMDEAVQIATTVDLDVVGIMTHFPNYDRDEVLVKSKSFYNSALDIIKYSSLNRDTVTIHSGNSFVALNVPEAHFDMVRPGGVLFGDQPTNPEFPPIFTFKTRIAALIDLPKGATVGYDSTVTLARKSTLANLPVGYSDSFPRKMGNRADVLVNGQRSKVIGVISMNTSMIDVTDLSGIKEGDEVVLFGHQGMESILAPEFEKNADVIFPEIYTQWGQTNPRIYVN
ncbi:alanine racemase [Shewanella sp. D64]|uniref:alanine racemase n=1 Tax=unclassified Shewanella TaxID=196818 RepID=UPI0022BA478D|nr:MULTISPECIES: alanine racemase [unclassified Shewanella]MEC4726682.1 alanine racemase [Shewanella sp. D64]MEC4738954.1 alanine racemase [Shewanella sp. E94]WBJ96896.1 alanine racemase [Shewanella sp. MTB7]